MAEKTTARVLITQKCNRNCPYCCNTYMSIMATAQNISGLRDLPPVKELLITGGEPLLVPNRTLRLIKQFREIQPAARIYVYSALWTQQMKAVIEAADGLHFTLHAAATVKDIHGLCILQAEMYRFAGKRSFRLYVNPDIERTVAIIPKLWIKIDTHPWIPESELRLPEHEQLYILAEKADTGGRQ